MTKRRKTVTDPVRNSSKALNPAPEQQGYSGGVKLPPVLQIGIVVKDINRAIE